MTSRIWRWLAFLPLVGTLVAVVVNVAVLPSNEETFGELAAGLIAFVSALSFAAIGGYLAFRIPRNAVGWLMSAYGFVFALVITSETVAATSAIVPVREWLAWFGSWSWMIPGSLITVVLPLLFPNGQVLTRRWRSVLWTLVLAFLLIFSTNAFNPESTRPIRNPLGRPEWQQALDAIGLLGSVLLLFCIGAAVVAVVKRFRRSQGIDRRQMQVFAPV